MFRNNPTQMHEMKLTLTQQCNLRCAYCYVPKTDGAVMSAEVVDAAVRLFLRHTRMAEHPTLTLFGGEPLLVRDRMMRAIDALRSADGQRSVRIALATNALLYTEDDARLLREHGVELRVGVDGGPGANARPFDDGTDSTAALLSVLRGLLQSQPASNVLARMTVTPANVGSLCASVRMLNGLGLRRIAYVPALELAWTPNAIERWHQEHLRIGTWMIGAKGAGARVAELSPWQAIEHRLAEGKPKEACGAGLGTCAVSVDGRVFPCHRFQFLESADVFEMGNVWSGLTHPEVAERFAEIDPLSLRPEHGSCEICAARGGCTHYCPAQGQRQLGDLRGVPRAACELMRRQVDAVQLYLSAGAGSAARRRAMVPKVAATVLLTAAAAAAAAASCGGKAEPTPTALTQPDATAVDAPLDAADAGDVQDASSEDASLWVVLDASNDPVQEDVWNSGCLG